MMGAHNRTQGIPFSGFPCIALMASIRIIFEKLGRNRHVHENCTPAKPYQ
jgi:hypothetical protein